MISHVHMYDYSCSNLMAPTLSEIGWTLEMLMCQSINSWTSGSEEYYFQRGSALLWYQQKKNQSPYVVYYFSALFFCQIIFISNQTLIFFYYIYISNQTKPACRTPSSIPISSICLRQTSYDYNIEGIDQLETKYICSRVQKIV